MSDAKQTRFRCFGITYRAGFIEVMYVHPRHINLEAWAINPEAIREEIAWVTNVPESEITGNTEIELDFRQALELSDALQVAVATSTADHAMEMTCDECGSTFSASDATMSRLCRECAHYLYGKPNCAHSFRNGHCQRCLWDGQCQITSRH